MPMRKKRRVAPRLQRSFSASHKGPTEAARPTAAMPPPMPSRKSSARESSRFSNGGPEATSATALWMWASRQCQAAQSLLQLFQPDANLVFVFAGQASHDQLPMEAGGAFLHQIRRFGAGESPIGVRSNQPAAEIHQQFIAGDLVRQKLRQALRQEPFRFQ